MLIINSELNDIETILKLYDDGTEFQKTKFHKHWPKFDLSLIQTEIKEGQLLKIIEDNNIVCIFSIADNDPWIWGERDNDPSLYIHRIVTHPLYRGNGYLKNIISWAKNYGESNGKKFIRMDSWGDNQNLTDYYTKCGFTFLGISILGKVENLPEHYYEGACSSLFEIKLD